ncbi:6-phosphogluconolactonase [Alkaliflexus imshenetskii]|uniref:6-phosphogluconolactonase n=1 Tax=Alkaliflexus imshenetskii TaxID=286730 RepID=UPI0004B9E1BD|nr:6-phosphogluconolactonase [Alkaliflexus imshenetskii]
MKPQIKIFSDKTDLSRFFGDILEKESNEKDTVTIALSGGSTPKAIFDTLAAEYQNRIKWEKLRFFWGDERCVKPDDAESNYGMTRTHLFDKVPISESNVFRVKGELSPDEAASDYETIILGELPKENGWPQFDLMILGMGDDGHTASIFPYQIDLWDSENICEVATHPDSGQKRVTLTGNVINNAKQIIFLVTAKNKADKAHEIINEKGHFKTYPASLVNKKSSLWMMDEDAAALL